MFIKTTGFTSHPPEGAQRTELRVMTQDARVSYLSVSRTTRPQSHLLLTVIGLMSAILDGELCCVIRNERVAQIPAELY